MRVFPPIHNIANPPVSRYQRHMYGISSCYSGRMADASSDGVRRACSKEIRVESW